MAKKSKRKTIIKKMNLSDHTLDINIRRCNYNKFNFTDIDEYVEALTGSRKYQYSAIKQLMIYLWGGSYKSVTELAKENFSEKLQIQQRFGSEKIFLYHLPLPDRLSGVVHMATGTGKSYVIFAIAYLSLILGYTKRVLVLGPPSTIIEQGLRDKFREFMNRKDLYDKLPQNYRGKAINLLTDNDPIEDDSIVIENINAVYTFGSIQDTLFKNTDEVLVLGDEIHHAYSHLKFADNQLVLDREEGNEGIGETRNERLWMRFLKENEKITRHIGFTGTPYNQNEYFADILYNYSIKDAVEQRYIKEINAIIRTETDEGDSELTVDQRFEMVLKNHLMNKDKYSYKTKSGIIRVKPVTIFICPTQKNAQKRSEEFISFLVKYEQQNYGTSGADSELTDKMRKRVICVVSRISESEYKEELDHIEELNPDKPGGSVEFIFAVNKLSEGWDVENVFQIVPLEERVFNSKLLISQVLGRGMRLPRSVPSGQMVNNYPILTVTNHDRFASHIKELLDSVTQSDMYLKSFTLSGTENTRSRHNFSLFNLRYVPNARLENIKDTDDTKTPGKLNLTFFDETLGVNVVRTKDKKHYELQRNFYTVDQIVYEIFNRFKLRTFENLNFDFGNVIVESRSLEEIDIRQVITTAMQEAGIEGNKLSVENKKQIDIYFNQFLPKGKKRRVFENIEGDIIPISSSLMEKSSIRLSELERDRTAFLSEDYEMEIGDNNKFVLDYLNEVRGVRGEQEQLLLFQPDDYVRTNPDIIRTFINGDTRSPYVVNTSKLKNPQSIILVSHSPEKEFVFQIIEHINYIDSWIKAPDKNFYSIDYEYWKRGKDRVRRSFNPDFFIKIDLDGYISILEDQNNHEGIEKLQRLQDEGIEYIIRIVEIKSDEDQDEATPSKSEYAIAHFKKLNERLKEINIADLDTIHRKDAKQFYIFDLLTPDDYNAWFQKLRKGKLDLID